MITATAVIDCSRCGVPFTGLWPAEEEQEAPEPARQECPSCGHAETVEYPGWTFFTEAG